jgi:hypothetical protein
MCSGSKFPAPISTFVSNKVSQLPPTLWAILFVLMLCQGLSATTTTCTTGALPQGNGGDLIVTTGTCTVNAGNFQ